MPSSSDRVSANFQWGEFPGFREATETQLARGRELVRSLLQPARSALGYPILITSWIRPGPWSVDPDRVQGDSVHPTGAAVDAAARTQADTVRLFGWLAVFRRSALGELIYEQPKTGTTGHVHLTLPGWGGAGEVLWEEPGGQLRSVSPFSAASYLHPYELPGITAAVPPTGGHAGSWWWLLAAGALAGWIIRRSRA